jgi:hypothetical protein
MELVVALHAEDTQAVLHRNVLHVMKMEEVERCEEEFPVCWSFNIWASGYVPYSSVSMSN